VQEVDLVRTMGNFLEESSRPQRRASKRRAPVPAKPVAGRKRQRKPGEVEEFQIGEETPDRFRADVTEVAAFDVAQDASRSSAQAGIRREGIGKDTCSGQT